MARLAPWSLVLVLVLLPLGTAACGRHAPAPQGDLPVERMLTYAVSHILVTRDAKNPALSLVKILEIRRELMDGADFEEVARKRSENRETAEFGGWLGFMRPDTKDEFGGAVQALYPGTLSLPIETQQGFHLIYRHPYEEARAWERGHLIPAYGFFIPYVEDEAVGLSKGQAEARAKEAVERIRKGEITMGEAARRYSSVPIRREDCFIANVRDGSSQKDIYAGVSRAEPGELAPIANVPGAFAVLRRGVLLRANVRHILVQHVESPNRQLSVSRTKEDARAVAEKVLGDVLEDPSQWASAVKRFSDEPSSLPLDGWIGAVTNGDLLPAIEDAILATPPGTIYDKVVESPDGFHIIYRLD